MITLNNFNFSQTIDEIMDDKHTPKLIMIILLLVTPKLLYAQATLPSISNDPTKAQQALPPLNQPSDHSGSSFVLPNVPKQTELEKRGKSIEIKQIEFVGNTVFDHEELQAQVADYLDHPINASDLEAIRRKISQYYREHGYVNSGAVLVSQSVAEGILKLNIIEGKLTEVHQSGQERLTETYIADRLIEGSGTPLNVDDLQASYRRLLADPLIKQLNGRLMPGVHPGEANLDVQVQRNRPYQFYAGADDYATSAVGAYTGRMGGWVDNLTTLGERIDGQFIVNGGSLGYNTGISLPINARDTRLSFRYSQTNSTLIEAPLNSYNIATEIIGFDTGIAHPIYRSLSDELSLNLNFAVRHSQTLAENSCAEGSAFTGIIGQQSLCSSHVSVIRSSQRFIHRGDSLSALFYSTFNTGVNVLNATPTQTGGQSGQFFSWLGQTMLNQRLSDNGTQLVVKANIQLADRPLLPLERFSIGGVNTIRGYRENAYIRDNGFNSNLELKFPLYGDSEEKHSLYLVPFMDYGAAWNNYPNSVSTAADYLWSTGIGLNWLYKQVSVDFYWAHAFTPVVYPLGSKPLISNIQDDGIHFRFNINAF